MAVLDDEADQRIVRLQVHDVVLVDAWRHDQQRRRMHFFGQRRVLHQLHQLVLVDHRTGRDREIATDFEGGIVGHRDRALLEIADQVADAGGDALALGLDRGLDEFGIGRREVGGRHRIDVLSGDELQPVLQAAIGHRHRLGGLLQEFRIEQIGLPHVVEDRALAPLRRTETAISARRADHGRPLLAGLETHHAGPQLGVTLRIQLLQLGQSPRLGQRQRSRRRCGLAQGIAVLPCQLEEVLHHRLAELHHARHGGIGRIVRVGHLGPSWNHSMYVDLVACRPAIRLACAPRGAASSPEHFRRACTSSPSPGSTSCC